MKTTKLKSLIFAVLLFAGSQAVLQAQQYSIGWSVITGTGGTVSGGQYSIASTIGQADASEPMPGGRYDLAGGFWEVPGGPIMAIALTASHTITVAWPVPALGCFELQATASLNPANWVDVPNAVSFAGGVDAVAVTITVSDTAQFFRLVSPCQ